MKDRFEFFVARRYLRAKRKQAVISVITLISVAGVAAGVMALVVALAINNGFRSTLQRNLLGATAHVSILEKQPGPGIENWRQLAGKLRALPHVTAVSPSLYGELLFSGPVRSKGGILKGVDPDAGPLTNEVLRNLKAGSMADLKNARGLPGVILGSKMALNTGMMPGSVVNVINPTGEVLPIGVRPTTWRFRVVGIFESGFYELDDNWSYTSLDSAQQVFAVPDVVNSIELRLDDINTAPEIARQAEKLAGSKLAATHWMEQNKPILNALKTERVVTFITIGLIQMVAALNILIALVMMVMEKHKDIAILMSMGARFAQVRRIFMLEGVIIGVIGTVIGLIVGHVLCYFADKHRWLRLDEQVYSLAFVPFEARLIDTLWISGTAILVSFVATLYPARAATRVLPAEALRYE
ncbi:MAG TPA: ABC transporter permease [Bryobacteraceae bacterium]|nr:ABC transporter permease [Bryobacteraceae bacterium]